MFGLSVWEILVVVIVAVVLVNPRDLPAVARRLGRLYGRFRALGESVDRGIRDLEREPPPEPPPEPPDSPGAPDREQT